MTLRRFARPRRAPQGEVLRCGPRARRWTAACLFSCRAPSLRGGRVHLNIPLRGRRPRVVLVHCPSAELPPRLAAGLVAMEGPSDRVGERGRLVIGEREAVASGIRVDVADGRCEATDRAHDGDRSISKRDELTETARLET